MYKFSNRYVHCSLCIERCSHKNDFLFGWILMNTHFILILFNQWMTFYYRRMPKSNVSAFLYALLLYALWYKFCLVVLKCLETLPIIFMLFISRKYFSLFYSKTRYRMNLNLLCYKYNSRILSVKFAVISKN